jgi:tRNA pseudouridine13 synthase
VIDTTTDPSSGAIVASNVPSARKKKPKFRKHAQQEKPSGEYLHFTLYKENRDTIDALGHLARILKIRPQNLIFSGTKDRRAATSQRCCVAHQRAESLAGMNKILSGIQVGDFQYSDQPLRLGDNSGNEFVITAKDCITFQQDEVPVESRLATVRLGVSNAMDRMEELGWINYYGQQRFGNRAVGTHDVGKLILTGDFKGAVDLILSYDPNISARVAAGEVPEVSQRDSFNRDRACMIFQTKRDDKEALKYLPRRFAGESAVIQHLSRSQATAGDFTGAILRITRAIRAMYAHAYQSYVWNHVASKRWSLFGTRVVKGDLVIDDSDTSHAAVDQDGEDIVFAAIDGDEDLIVRARPLTAEEAESGRYTIRDIVLPLPGYDVVYPDNELGKFYEDFMGQEENGSLDPHNMRRKTREFSLSGAYRKLIARFLSKPSFEVRLYSDDTEQMHPTDLDIVKQKKAKGKRALEPEEDGGGHKKVKLDEGSNGHAADSAAGLSAADSGLEQAEEVAGEYQPHKVAVVLKFQLGKSAYATIALRELMGECPEEEESS